MCHYKHLTLEERQKQEIFCKTGIENLESYCLKMRNMR